MSLSVITICNAVPHHFLGDNYTWANYPLVESATNNPRHTKFLYLHFSVQMFLQTVCNSYSMMIFNQIHWNILNLVFYLQIYLYLLIADLQVSCKLYSLASNAVNIRSIFIVCCGSRVPKPLLGWISINCTEKITWNILLFIKFEFIHYII